MRYLAVILVVATVAASTAFAQQIASPTCRPLSDVTADTTARDIASLTRSCVDQGDPRTAIQLYLTYSTYILFDQQRVKDESAHLIVGELNSWILTGYDFNQMKNIKVWVDKLRDPDSAYLKETCAGVLALGPPTYRPDYMIKRGMQPRKTDDDWRTRNFDPDFAWDHAVHGLNPCPRP